jgi:hypothetical protein
MNRWALNLGAATIACLSIAAVLGSGVPNAEATSSDSRPAANTTSAQVLARSAIATSASASSFRVRGRFEFSGKPDTVDLSLSADASSGSIAEGHGIIRVREIEKTLYMNASPGREWFAVPKTIKGIKQILVVLNPRSLMSNMISSIRGASFSGPTKSEVTGISAVQVDVKGGHGITKLFIAARGQSYILQMSGPEGSLTFSNYNEPVRVVAPTLAPVTA